MASRGQLTPAIAHQMEKFHDAPVTTTHLRLYPYIDWMAKNNERVDPRKVNAEERAIISAWRAAGHLNAEGVVHPSFAFYQHIQAVLWLAYVNYEEE